MPTIFLFEGIGLASALAGFDTAFNGQVLLQTNSNVIIEDEFGNGIGLQSDSSDFVYSQDTGLLSNGTVDGVSIVLENNLVATIDLNLPYPLLEPALLADFFGTDNAALENLLLPMGWTVYGSDAKDELSLNAVSDDGVALDLSGRDIAYLEGGNDKFAAGAEKDFVYGGDGNDKIWGEKGNDRLYGDKGADTLFGNGGNDRMYGGRGNDDMRGGNGKDQIRGGNGNDQINGGGGDDVLTGNNGADTFIFLGFNYGDDVVTDFEVGVDFLSGEVETGNATIEDQGGDALVRASGGSVLFEGVSVDDLRTVLPNAFVIENLG
ncbi:calcium-binding protein [Algirhabdus cladophorae]|uniref:calcium-binding protein n=1 Tax=Algirhabdus cladophorae TaxID=3377108 RepID=UPI003B849472